MTGTDDPGPGRRRRAPKASKAAKATKAIKATEAAAAAGIVPERAEDAAPSPTSPEALAVWLAGRRWFGGGAAEVSLGTVALPTELALAVGLVDTADGRRHQLLVPAEPGADRADVGDDPVAADELARWVARGGVGAETDLGQVRAHWLPAAGSLGDAPARPLGGEQSNTSVVVGGTHVLKLLRRLQPGTHPEVEVGRHLAAVADADPTHPLPVARLAGWYELVAPGRTDLADDTTTLGVVQVLVPGALDAWALVLSALAGDAGALLARLRLLGVSLARLHGALARPAERVVPDDGPGSFGVVALTRGRIDEVVAGVSADARRLLGADTADPALPTALADRGDEVAELAASLAARLGTDLGSAIRHHGDLHLGQVVDSHAGWVVLDFEGEPSRPLAERRLRHSPLRDVAGMLRSLAYAAATHRRAEGHRLAPGWEPAARAAFLDGYLATVEPALLPASPVATRTLLTLLELEKVVYEIDYELAHRPDWVGLPVAGLSRLLDAGTA